MSNANMNVDIKNHIHNNYNVDIAVNNENVGLQLYLSADIMFDFWISLLPCNTGYPRIISIVFQKNI